MTDDPFEELDGAKPVTSGKEDSVAGEVDSENAAEFRELTNRTSSSSQSKNPHPVDYDTYDSEGEIPCIEPRVHAFGAHLLFADTDDTSDDHPGSLSPYDAVVSQYEPSIAEDVGEFVFDDELWEIDPEKTRYWSGGIAAPGRPYDTFNEYQISVRAQDGLGERKATLQLRPSVPDARTEGGDRIDSMPEDLPYGLRVQVSSSNLDPEEVVPLIRRVAEELDIHPDYFSSSRVHDYSCVYQLEMYVRIARSKAEHHVVTRGGILDELTQFAQNNRGRGECKWDNEEVIGHRTALTMSEVTWQKLMRKDVEVGKTVKNYHPKYARSESTDEDPLSDPKLEVQWSKEYSDRSSVPWEDTDEYDVDDLHRELDESLINVIDWAGLSTRADPRVYVEDHYFDATESERDLDIVENRMDSLREAEEKQTVAHFARGDATEGERSVIAALTDGGERADVEEVAEMSDTSRSTVYRTAQRFSDIVSISNAKMSFEDSVIRDKFQDLLSVFEETAEWVIGGVRQLASDESTLLDQDSALARWARRHGVSVTQSPDGMVVDLGGRPLTRLEVFKLLRAGVDAAESTGKMAYQRFISAEFSWVDPEQGRKSHQKPINNRGAVLRP
ncbi:hypothetical protein JCM17823_14520 [Halorubrum gandharaense]